MDKHLAKQNSSPSIKSSNVEIIESINEASDNAINVHSKENYERDSPNDGKQQQKLTFIATTISTNEPANILTATHVESTSFEDNRRMSASRDSSLNNDDPKSLGDYSISAASSKQNWSVGKGDYDPSISSIKGDSISALIADYNRKYNLQQQTNNNNNNDDYQSRTSARLMNLPSGEESSSKVNDDSASNINYYAAGSSNSNYHNQASSSKHNEPVAVQSTTNNVDAFDIIEESSDVSSCENFYQLASENVYRKEGIYKSENINDKSNRFKSRDINSRISNKNHNNRKNSSKHRTKRQELSSIQQALDIEDLPQEISFNHIEPIILRGNGNLTLFGLSNSFSNEFPPSLIGRVSKEEFNTTMRRVNSLLREQQSLSAKLLIFGGLCCCCSFGLSLFWPSTILKKRSKLSLEKLLASENNRLYSKLGLNWKLSEQRCYSNHSFIEYVLMIEFLPKINIYVPD